MKWDKILRKRKILWKKKILRKRKNIAKEKKYCERKKILRKRKNWEENQEIENLNYFFLVGLEIFDNITSPLGWVTFYLNEISDVQKYWEFLQNVCLHQNPGLPPNPMIGKIKNVEKCQNCQTCCFLWLPNL